VPETKIRIDNLSKTFSGQKALDGLSFEVGDGEILTLIGPSGAGKTLALKCILGLIPADSGQMAVAGQPVPSPNTAEHDAYLRQFGILFQRSGLFDGLPVWENIGFRLLQQPGNSRSSVRELAADKVQAVGLSEDVVDLYPAELSGGMQKRVGIARALAGEPPILFLDEPTAGLDPIMSNVINNLILSNVRKLGSTVIVVTSNLATAEKVSDRVAMLHQGRCVWSGKTEEAVRSEDPFLYQFWNKKKDGPIDMPVTSMAF